MSNNKEKILATLRQKIEIMKKNREFLDATILEIANNDNADVKNVSKNFMDQLNGQIKTGALTLKEACKKVKEMQASYVDKNSKEYIEHIQYKIEKFKEINANYKKLSNLYKRNKDASLFKNLKSSKLAIMPHRDIRNNFDDILKIDTSNNPSVPSPHLAKVMEKIFEFKFGEIGDKKSEKTLSTETYASRKKSLDEQFKQVMAELEKLKDEAKDKYKFNNQPEEEFDESENSTPENDDTSGDGGKDDTDGNEKDEDDASGDVDSTDTGDDNEDDHLEFSSDLTVGQAKELKENVIKFYNVVNNNFNKNVKSAFDSAKTMDIKKGIIKKFKSFIYSRFKKYVIDNLKLNLETDNSAIHQYKSKSQRSALETLVILNAEKKIADYRNFFPNQSNQEENSKFRQQKLIERCEEVWKLVDELENSLIGNSLIEDEDVDFPIVNEILRYVQQSMSSTGRVNQLGNGDIGYDDLKGFFEEAENCLQLQRLYGHMKIAQFRKTIFFRTYVMKVKRGGEEIVENIEALINLREELRNDTLKEYCLRNKLNNLKLAKKDEFMLSPEGIEFKNNDFKQSIFGSNDKFYNEFMDCFFATGKVIRNKNAKKTIATTSKNLQDSSNTSDSNDPPTKSLIIDKYKRLFNSDKTELLGKPTTNSANLCQKLIDSIINAKKDLDGATQTFLNNPRTKKIVYYFIPDLTKFSQLKATDLTKFGYLFKKYIKRYNNDFDITIENLSTAANDNKKIIALKKYLCAMIIRLYCETRSMKMPTLNGFIQELKKLDLKAIKRENDTEEI